MVTTDLTNLQRAYTFLRNRVRTCRRRGFAFKRLERQAKEAAKEFHDAIQRQRKADWQKFLQDDANIWQAARFLASGSPAFDVIPPLARKDDSTAQGKDEQAEELLKTFFPPLPQEIDDELVQHQHPPVP
jgi:hypothetical protein